MQHYVYTLNGSEKMEYMTKDYKEKEFSGNLDMNIKLFKDIFKNDAILRNRTVNIGDTGYRASVFYMDGMVNSEILNESVIKPLVLAEIKADKVNSKNVSSKILFAGEVSEATTLDAAIRGVLYGDTVLMVESDKTVLVINTKGWRTRGVTEPSDERVLKGPREGFDEAALLNIALIRRKLLTPDLCVELQRVGRRTETIVFICYLGSLADKGVLKELKKRIASIDIDGILDSNYIAELINGKDASLLKTMGTTERPDIVAARLLEGKIAIVVDGTPVVLTVPYLFSENFQSDEDYYVNYLIASASRMMRYVCFFLAVSVPAVFVALLTHHLGLLPTNFMLSVSALREGVPMSSVTECILLILVFEILKETGLRTPQSQGFALSIVGGLVVGQAAVEAKIVSAPMLIAVALSGIAGLMIPRLRSVVFYLRFVLVLLSAFLGLYGYIIGFSLFVLFSLSLKSFGVDTQPFLASPMFNTFKDTIIRAPWSKMEQRPIFNANKTRLKRRDKND